MNLDRVVALMLAAVTLLYSLDGAADTKPLPIRIGWVVVPQTLEPIYFEKPGIARHLGSSYVMEPLHFAGSTPEITALAANELDIAPFVFSSLAFAVKNAGLDDLRIICDEVQDGVEGYYSNEYMVLKDGPIKTAEDLKGKVLAPNVLGGLADMGIRAFMQKHGLEPNRDYSLVEVSFPNMKAELIDRKVDLISAVGPFSHDPILRDKARTLFTQRDAFGTTQLSALVARADFIQKNRAALVDFSKTFFAQFGGTPIPRTMRKRSPLFPTFTTRSRKCSTVGCSRETTTIETPTAFPTYLLRSRISSLRRISASSKMISMSLNMPISASFKRRRSGFIESNKIAPNVPMALCKRDDPAHGQEGHD